MSCDRRCELGGDCPSPDNCPGRDAGLAVADTPPKRGEVIPLKVIDEEPCQSAIEVAQDIYERCRSGEFIEVTIIAIRRDGSYTTCGSKVDSTIHTMGCLTAALLDLNDATR